MWVRKLRFSSAELAKDRVSGRLVSVYPCQWDLTSALRSQGPLEGLL